MNHVAKLPAPGLFFTKCKRWVAQAARDTARRVPYDDNHTEALEKYSAFIDRAAKVEYFNSLASHNNKFVENFCRENRDIETDVRAVQSVASTEYLAWLNGEYVSKWPDMTAEQSRIPALRQLMYEVPADANCWIYSEHIRRDMHRILRRGERLFERGGGSGAFTRLEDSNTILKSFRKARRELQIAMKQRFRDFLTDGLRRTSEDGFVKREALIGSTIGYFLERQHDLHWNTYLKIIRCKGILGPDDSQSPRFKGVGTNWNAEISELFHDELHAWQDAMAPHVRSLVDNLKDAISEGGEKIKASINDSLPSYNENLQFARVEWESREDRFDNVFRGFSKIFMASITTAFNYAIDERDLNGMMVKLLSSAYDRTKAVVRGPGLLDRMRESFKDALLEPGNPEHSLVKSYVAELKRYFQEVIDMKFKELESNLGEELVAFEEVLQDFGRVEKPMLPATKQAWDDLQRLLPKLRSKYVEMEERFPPAIKGERELERMKAEDDS